MNLKKITYYNPAATGYTFIHTNTHTHTRACAHTNNKLKTLT